MNRYSVSQLSDDVLVRRLVSLLARNYSDTAWILAHIGEIDARHLYVPAAYPSMLAYCVGELKFTEDAARPRIWAARTARKFPAILTAVAAGRLHLTAIIRLAHYITDENVDELLASAAYKSKAEIERFLAERFPAPELSLEETRSGTTDSTGTSSATDPLRAATAEPQQARLDAPALDEPMNQRVPERVAPRERNTPKRSLMKLMAESTMRDKLQYAQELLSHQIPSGDVSQVIERGLDLLIAELEKRKFAATSRPRSGRSASHSLRHIPAAVKRAVCKRDAGQCTFVSETGKRCASRKFLEFDHVEPVARGGNASLANIRLRCRTHNQYAAERAFGSEFMNHKRRAAAEARAAREMAAPENASASASPVQQNHDP